MWSLAEITLIMVTHDTSLKAYASRVVHMIDGKIHRIEAIADATRQSAYSELAKKVKRISRVQWIDSEHAI
jgi:ABC-type lipoprotein export system ATPase subunit